ncbi:cyclic-phosphate processing receiver domain-containing protein [Trinickia mobilis]|uniref:cyclic-phosphate processing receiver domain-containing protein n=1 Tax=Trinickia mobilis TaxID=2816356 RepID=UPI001A8C4ADD|nr:cyclic-phosphate processing receiver domain-containing protein [Trinickia mobilis]
MTAHQYKLFIDDLRETPSPGWEVARTSAQAIALLERRGCPSEISFDHDLGGEDTSMVVVKRMIEMDLDAGGQFIPEHFTFAVHSANPVGRDNINGLLLAYLRHRARRNEPPL